ncbi:MAG: mismatch-specific DNA-glycosylase [Betaproteobacteria bacterium]|nr:mismatch-specific DNA-glycosylase [Betaproteobacteria bacterium]
MPLSPTSPPPRGRGYLVPDLLGPNLRLVFCGTAPSRASAAAKAYYAKPGNKFWPTLHQVGITPRGFAPHEYPELLKLDIGLTDLGKVHSGVDSELPDDAFDLIALKSKIARYQPALVAFTSKNAAQSALEKSVAYGLQAETWGKTQFFVLPSPSGLATRFFDIGVWQELARWLGRKPSKN